MKFGTYTDATPISWLKVASAANYEILLSEYVVSARAFQSERKREKLNWNESSLFHWLHDVFLKHYFSETEREQILEVNIPTIEQIVLWLPERKKRKCYASEQAISDGIELFSESSNSCTYWLQNTGRREGYSATVVRSCGNIYRSAYMMAGNVGVRPYLKIRKQV